MCFTIGIQCLVSTEKQLGMARERGAEYSSTEPCPSLAWGRGPRPEIGFWPARYAWMVAWSPTRLPGWISSRSESRVRARLRRPYAPVTLALHKPRGIVTTRSDERGRQTVYHLLSPGVPYVFPVGRLDADSEGLLILTNDAALSVRLTDPACHVPKTYRVTVAGRPDEAASICSAAAWNCPVD